MAKCRIIGGAGLATPMLGSLKWSAVHGSTPLRKQPDYILISSAHFEFGGLNVQFANKPKLINELF